MRKRLTDMTKETLLYDRMIIVTKSQNFNIALSVPLAMNRHE